jgi:hypothetical protein
MYLECFYIVCISVYQFSGVRGRKYQDAGGKCVIHRFIISILPKILLG